MARLRRVMVFVFSLALISTGRDARTADPVPASPWFSFSRLCVCDCYCDKPTCGICTVLPHFGCDNYCPKPLPCFRFCWPGSLCDCYGPKPLPCWPPDPCAKIRGTKKVRP
jgi:hypothetical protein